VLGIGRRCPEGCVAGCVIQYHYSGFRYQSASIVWYFWNMMRNCNTLLRAGRSPPKLTTPTRPPPLSGRNGQMAPKGIDPARGRCWPVPRHLTDQSVAPERQGPWPASWYGSRWGRSPRDSPVRSPWASWPSRPLSPRRAGRVFMSPRCRLPTRMRLVNRCDHYRGCERRQKLCNHPHNEVGQPLVRSGRLPKMVRTGNDPVAPGLPVEAICRGGTDHRSSPHRPSFPSFPSFPSKLPAVEPFRRK